MVVVDEVRIAGNVCVVLASIVFTTATRIDAVEIATTYDLMVGEELDGTDLYMVDVAIMV